MAKRKAPAKPAAKPRRYARIEDVADDATPHVPKVKALPPMPQAEREALPDWPELDPLEVEREKAKHAIEGNRTLQLVCDALRECLQEIHSAEINLATKQEVTPRELRALAREGLEEYARLTGTPWRRNRVVKTRASRSVQFRDIRSDELKREGYE